jgi:prepilin-type N-terminal cleavage/methylation domain-containing protein
MQHGARHLLRATGRMSGYTLMELLVAIGVLTILSGALGQALIVGMQMVAMTSVNARSASLASTSMALALRHVEDGALATTIESDRFAYFKPAVGPDGYYLVDPPGELSGRYAIVELGEEWELFYDPAQKGLFLGDLGSSNPPEQVAEGVVACEFLYNDGLTPALIDAPSTVKSITIVLETQADSGKRVATTEVRKTVRLRNHM